MVEAGTKKRPPIVVVMGHVDHGKTTLLDTIRKTNVASREAGGITQSIGAYEIIHNGGKITFIDTPGHEAFSRMRIRGAQAADIAILVVAADDGVQPQTKETINILRETKTHFIVAINKTDRAGVDINKAKNELTAAGVLLEGYGGNVSFQAISAKTGAGVEELLDLVLLAADVEGLTYDPSRPARGIIIEAKRDARRGVTATGIILDGTLRTGTVLHAGTVGGQARALEDFKGKRIVSAEPSSPVMILGFLDVPPVGSEFKEGTVPQQASDAPVRRAPAPAAPATQENTPPILRLILKAESSGSLEALREVIVHASFPKGTPLQVMDAGIGDISDGDVQHAISTSALILGFRVGITKAADGLAKAHRIRVIQSEIIYELLQAIEETFRSIGKEEIKGELEILASFGTKEGNQIVGGRVLQGVMSRNASFEIRRRSDTLGIGKIVNVQIGKRDVPAVEAGNECGLLVRAEKEIKAGDRLAVLP